MTRLPVGGVLFINQRQPHSTNDVVVQWDANQWRRHEDNVRGLRRRIFTAAKEQDLAKVRSLQKMMLRSWSNTLVSVRQVTQRNTGRGTAGIDGQVALTDRDRNLDRGLLQHPRRHSANGRLAPIPFEHQIARARAASTAQVRADVA
jgi:hypothetical protein